MTPDGKRVFRNVVTNLALIAATLMTLSWLVRSSQNDFYTYGRDNLFIVTGFTVLTGLTWLILRFTMADDAVVIIEVRPNADAQEHSKILDRLAALDTERSTLINRKNELESQQSESSPFRAS